MASRKPLFLSAEGYSEEMTVSDDIQLGGLTMGGNIAMGTNKVTGMGDGSASQDAVTKSQLDAAVINGGTVKELIFDQRQLDDTDGIEALMVAFFENIPVVGDSFTLTDGTLTRTYDFVANIAGESAATDVSIETDAATAMQRFVTRMLADASNTVWDSVFRATEHPDLHADGVIMLYEKTTAAGASPSRVYGTFTTQADLQIVEFASGATPDVDLNYENETAATASTTDPAAGRFGLRRTQANLTAGEIHFVRTDDSQYAWDDDTNTWQILSGSAAIPDATAASGGGVKGKVTFDSDKGLDVSSGIAEVTIDAVTIDFSGGNLVVTGVPLQFEINGTAVSTAVTAPNLGTLTAGASSDAQSLHTHDDLADGSHTHSELHARSHDIESTSDHTLSGAAAGEVLRASGATTFAFSQLSHSDLGSVGVNDHHNQSHVLTGGDHTESGLTSGHILTASGATTYGWATPAAAEEAKKLENTFNTATDVTANGDPAYWNAADTLGKARADTDAKSHVVGVIKSGAGAPPTAVEIVHHGACAGVLVTATPNANYFLQAAGGIGTALPGGGNRVIRVGWAKNTTDLWVNIHDYGKKAA